MSWCGWLLAPALRLVTQHVRFITAIRRLCRNPITGPRSRSICRATVIDLPSVQDPVFQPKATALAAYVRELAARGWTPATSSNFSIRFDQAHAAITISGRDKSQATIDDFMLVDLQGRGIGTDARPSAETLLHMQIYARLPEAGAVLHTHSKVQTLASKLYAPEGRVVLEGYELLKAFDGYATHQARLVLPVLGNSQDMKALAREVEAIHTSATPYGYLIEGHGLYAWGRDLQEARRHLEAFEFLLDCELELRKLRR